ncbi:MAG: starch-binding protein, partial [Bacilli bacterium]|nr:starch-binding protein [Bacilli bacterium]
KYLYSSVPSKNMTSTLYQNETIENSSFYPVYQKAIQAKNRTSVLYNGAVSKGPNGGNSEVGSYFAEKGNDSATVIFNCGSTWKRGQVSGGSAILGEASLEGVSHYENGSITLAPYSAMVLKGKAALTSISKIDTEPTASSSESSLEIDPPGQEIFSEATGNLLIHCKNTNNWSKMNCYAWVDKNQYCGAWPGASMSKEGDWYTISIPHGAANLIFNDGKNQTENLHRPSEGEYWFLMAKGSGNSISGDWYRQNPDL